MLLVSQLALGLLGAPVGKIAGLLASLLGELPGLLLGLLRDLLPTASLHAAPGIDGGRSARIVLNHSSLLVCLQYPDKSLK